METTNSLWAPITGHVLNNLIVILFLRYGPINKMSEEMSEEMSEKMSEGAHKEKTDENAGADSNSGK